MLYESNCARRNEGEAKMTKKDPDKLCKSCWEFDYAMNRNDGVSFDMYVRCDHDEEVYEVKEKEK